MPHITPGSVSLDVFLGIRSRLLCCRNRSIHFLFAVHVRQVFILFAEASIRCVGDSGRGRTRCPAAEPVRYSSAKPRYKLFCIEAGIRRDAFVRSAVITAIAGIRNGAGTAVDRIRIRGKRPTRPRFADKIEATDHPENVLQSADEIRRRDFSLIDANHAGAGHPARYPEINPRRFGTTDTTLLALILWAYGKDCAIWRGSDYSRADPRGSSRMDSISKRLFRRELRVIPANSSGTVRRRKSNGCFKLSWQIVSSSQCAAR